MIMILNKRGIRMKEDIEYYGFEKMIRWLNFFYFLKKEFPFNRKQYDKIKCGWGMLLIPREGIEETVYAKITDQKEVPLKRISALFQLPFEYEGKVGVINKDVSLTFRYDKTYKYGEITKSIYEVCYWLDKYAIKTNDFYIVDNDLLFTFMSNYVICNQWGLGREYISNSPMENLGFFIEDGE